MLLPLHHNLTVAHATVTHRNFTKHGGGQNAKYEELISLSIGSANSRTSLEVMTRLRKVQHVAAASVRSGGAAPANLPSLDEAVAPDGKITPGTALTIEWVAPPADEHFLFRIVGY